MPERIARVNLHPVPPGARVRGRRDGRAARVLPARRRARGDRAGETVAVLGAGPIGLMLCACVADAGGRPVARRRSRGTSRARAGVRRRARRRRGRGRRDRGDGHGRGWRDAVDARAPRRDRGRLRRPPRATPRSRRRVPRPLRRADAARRVPPHAADRARSARVPRERRVPVGAARHARGLARGLPALFADPPATTSRRSLPQAANSVRSGSRSPRRTRGRPRRSGGRATPRARSPAASAPAPRGCRGRQPSPGPRG